MDLQVKLEDIDTHEELVFYVDRWLALDQDDGHVVREMPVIRKGTPSLPGKLSTLKIHKVLSHKLYQQNYSWSSVT